VSNDHPDHAEHHDARPPRSEASKLARQVEANDIKWLMSNRQGRRIVWRLLAQAGVYRDSFTGNSTTFYNEGRRSAGLSLLSDVVAHAHDSYILMLTEAKAKTE